MDMRLAHETILLILSTGYNYSSNLEAFRVGRSVVHQVTCIETVQVVKVKSSEHAPLAP